ncbi:MAG TPA: hypothetical protein VJ962_03050 [Clostridia bacterium]|nr:hypothetical protein [Clostridia bacterium]
MKIEIDTTNKTITLLEDITYKEIKELFPGLVPDINDYTIKYEPDNVIYSHSIGYLPQRITDLNVNYMQKR